jgi:ubiquinone/menaquinone biosynthesis C-methylase UbiE
LIFEIIPLPPSSQKVYNRPVNNPESSRIPLEETQFTRREAARFYDAHARRFMMPVFRRFAARAAKICPPGSRVLDAGTGSGLAAIELAKARPDLRITGIDIAEDMLVLARENVCGAALDGQITLQRADAAGLPFPGGFFDVVVSNASLHLWQNPVKVFNEMARAAGGSVCASVSSGRFSVLAGRRWGWIKRSGNSGAKRMILLIPPRKLKFYWISLP